ADPEKASKGERIYRAGIASKNVPACMGCHGPSGAGNPPAVFPSLSGQHPEYIAKTMKDFRAGTRNNDPKGMMRDVVARMSDAEIAAVAEYVSGLH
ncbi:MAG TPA: c-type cytochrome, partial [Gammaproteobacteria bacterium]|nr:c-type cytochrome [Gammaproteobacteria bacterium]